LKRYHYLFLGGKCIIILNISVERIGPLTFLLALLGSTIGNELCLPEENTVLGRKIAENKAAPRAWKGRRKPGIGTPLGDGQYE